MDDRRRLIVELSSAIETIREIVRHVPAALEAMKHLLGFTSKLVLLQEGVGFNYTHGFHV